ncbi:MAG: ImmA/IrrE family metallo-endopeptidase [Eubacterium sp.]|nr:ImmA/IrrE family metallo-endopeptidase [Eubacterium sp.]
MRYFNFQKVVKWCNNIKNIFDYYVKKCGSRNPFAIADFLNIQIQIGQLGTTCGCYMFLKNYRCIFLNENLSENEMDLVMSHELGHAIMHRKLNCYYIRNKTLLLDSKIETEANTFAINLLVPDENIMD